MIKLNARKIISLLLCIAVLFIMPLTTISASATTHIKGDVDKCGKVTAIDARTVLRHSAQLLLNPFTDKQLKLVDMDFNGTVDAVDARKLLRVAAKIDELYYATVYNYYDKGQVLYYYNSFTSQNQTNVENKIHSYMKDVAIRYKDLLDLYIFWDGAGYYNSPIAQCSRCY